MAKKASNAESTDWWSIGAGTLAFVATLLAYLPALHGGYLWDDNFHITAPELRSLDGLRRIWGELGATQQYYPLLHSAFWVEHKLWGDAVTGYHLVNILLHATAAFLVMSVVRRLALPGAILAGMVFALHPVMVESVAWISEQKNTLSAVFYLGAMLAYLRYDRDRRRSQYALALGLFVLALLTKTVTATLPAALLVVFWWQRGRLEWKRDALPLLPWLALGVAAGLFTAWVERTYIGAQGADFDLTGLERGLLAGRVTWFYLGKLLWPANLIFIYPHWAVSSAAAWQWLFPLGGLALLAGLWFTARRNRGPLAGFLIFAGTLFPVMGFFNVYPFRYSYVADHFQYLASLGIIVPLAVGLTRAAGRLPAPARWLGAAGLLLTLGTLTWRQCGMYRDAWTLYQETLRRNPECSMAHTNLGDLLMKMPGRVPEAIGHFEAALRSSPRNVEAHNNLGHAYAETGRLPEAIARYEEALRLYPGFAPAHNNLGLALQKIPGREAEAIEHLETAVRLFPGSREMHSNLAVALAKIPGRAAEAAAYFEAEVRRDPDSADLRNNLGVALVQIPGRLPEAAVQFEAAVRLKPDSTEMQSNLGVVLAQLPGRLPEAIPHFETAVRLAPGSAAAHHNLAAALEQVPARRKEALAHYEEALRLDPAFAAAREAAERLRLGQP